jgi:hypothetical protein
VRKCARPRDKFSKEVLRAGLARRGGGDGEEDGRAYTPTMYIAYWGSRGPAPSDKTAD